MATFVLVHGAWTGTYDFRKLRHDRGHELSTPTLPGIGERTQPVCLAQPLELT